MTTTAEPEAAHGPVSALTGLLGGGYVSIPASVAVCPECGGALHAECNEWETETGIPIIGGLNIDCKSDPDCNHRHWQCDWQPVKDAVEEWCGAVAV